MTTAQADTWPAKPESWPPILTEIEAAQYLRLPESGKTPASAKRTMRYLRQHSGLPSAGRIAGGVLYRRASIDAWMDERGHDTEP